MQRRIAQLHLIAVASECAADAAKVSPDRFVASRIVPFDEPKSSTINLSPSRQMRAWRREIFVCGSNFENQLPGKYSTSGRACQPDFRIFFETENRRFQIVRTDDHKASPSVSARAARSELLLMNAFWRAAVSRRKTRRTYRSRRFSDRRSRRKPAVRIKRRDTAFRSTP